MRCVSSSLRAGAALLSLVMAVPLVMCTPLKSDAESEPDRLPCENDATCSAQGGAGSEPLAVGSPGCSSGLECASGFCLPDAEGVLRCCEAECRIASGRVCSTAGECVCDDPYREVAGRCLLREGQPCREPTECASNHCADGVCCDEACDGICERCDALAELGTCSFHERDPACENQTNFACVARDRCRLPLSFACRSDADCDSEHCQASLNGQAVCCDAACSGTCQRCDGSGSCSFPPSDPACPVIAACPAPTTCLEYRVPEPRACRSSGECAPCEPLYTRAGIPCGVGAQCDGAGACEQTGLGLVAAGTRHTCAIRSNGNVRCWGNNTSGQLGAAFDRPFVGDDETPGDVDNLEINFDRTVLQITTGLAHTCVLFQEDGQVRCWGRLDEAEGYGPVPGLLGTDDVAINAQGFVDPLNTRDVRLPEPAVQISAGDTHSCAVLETGKVSCWGRNNFGQCGIGEASVSVGGLSNENLPILVLDPTNPDLRAIAVRAGAEHTCALLSTGQVTCWGLGSDGRLGYGDTSNRLAPDGHVPIGEPVFQIAAGFGHTCALLERGRVRCWGRNDDGELGYGHALAIGDDETPEQAATIPRAPGSSVLLGGDALLGGGGVEQITTIADTPAACARFSNGTVRCWGRNDRGQLGYGHTQSDGDLFPPEQLALRRIGERAEGGDIPLGGFAIALADGGRCAFVRSEASTTPALHCWGLNLDAQLGLPEFFTEGSAQSTPGEMGAVRWEQ